MAFKLKRSSTNKIPQPGDLVTGEPGLNTQIGVLFARDQAGYVHNVGESVLMLWDGAVSQNGPKSLGTHAEGATVNVSVGFASGYSAGSVSYSVASGSLPPGLALNSSTGAITGTAPNLLTTTSYNFTVMATHGACYALRECTITITADNDAPVWSTAAAMGTIASASVSFQFSAPDPEGQAVTYTLSSGSLPAGLSLSSSGLLSGTNTHTQPTNYSFTLQASDGTNASLRSFTLTLDCAPGEAVFTTPGTYSWTCPANVTKVCAVAVGGGGGGGSALLSHTYCAGGGSGGGLGYCNSITVVPGTSYSVVVGDGGLGGTHVGDTSATAGSSGQNSTFTVGAIVVTGRGGNSGAAGSTTSNSNGGAAVSFSGSGVTGGFGGSGGSGGSSGGGGGGGGGNWAGATGTGGNGGNNTGATGGTAQYGGGGGGGGGASNKKGGSGGGGVGLYGQGANGSNGSGGSGGSAGTSASIYLNNGTVPWTNAGKGGLYGGAGGGHGAYTNPPTSGAGAPGGSGAVRIIWGGNRSFPSNAA